MRSQRSSDVSGVTYKIKKQLNPEEILYLIKDAKHSNFDPSGLLAWGYNAKAELGLGVEKFVWRPRNLQLDAIKVVSAQDHTCVLAADGKLYTMGSNKMSVLGNNLPNKTRQKPQTVKLPNVIDMACADHHTLAVTEEGSVFVWGESNFGKRGDDPSARQLVSTGGKGYEKTNK